MIPNVWAWQSSLPDPAEQPGWGSGSGTLLTCPGAVLLGWGWLQSSAHHQTPNNSPGTCSHCAGKGSSTGQDRRELWDIWGKCFTKEERVWAGQEDRDRTGCSGSGQVHFLICDGLNSHLAQDMDLTWESSSSAVREPQTGTDSRQILGDFRGLSPALDMLRAGKGVAKRN